MVAAHENLQRAAAEMNTFRLSTMKFKASEVDILSQQLSQMAGDFSANPPLSPLPHRTKRSRLGEISPKLPRTPLAVLTNRDNVKQVGFSGSITEDEEDIKESPIKKIESEYGDLMGDEAFSQFEL
jgi:hypothetical protein